MGTVEGCDSLVTLTLTVHPVYAPSIAAEICDGESYTVGTTDYTTTGVWVTNLTSINGCDSTVTLDLTVHPVYSNESITAEICKGESYAVGDSVYTTSGSWITSMSTINECDSIVTLYLTVYPVYDQAVSAEICEGESYAVGDSVYTTSGTYPTLMGTVEGCDSLVTLTLTVHPVYAPSIAAEICEGESYTVRDYGLYDNGGLGNQPDEHKRLRQYRDP